MLDTVDGRVGFFQRSIRANLAYWRATCIPNPNVTAIPERDWPNLVRAINYALEVPETRADAGQMALDLFDAVEHRASWSEWIPLLERLAAAQTDPLLRAGLLDHLGQCLRLAGQYRRSLDLHRAVLAQAAELGDEALQAHALANAAETSRYLRQFADSERDGKEALQVLQSHQGERRTLLSVLNTLGFVSLALGRTDDAIDRLRQALDLAEELDLHLYVCRLSHNLGNALAAARRGDEAVACYARAEAGLRALGNPVFEVASLQLARGTLHFVLGQYDLAGDVFGQIDVHRLRRLGHLIPAAEATNNLGNVLQAQGRFEESEETMREAVALFRDLEDPVELANALGVLGEVVAAQGRRAEAEPHWREAIALLEPYTADVRVQRLLAGARKNLEEYGAR